MFLDVIDAANSMTGVDEMEKHIKFPTIWR